MPNETAKPDDFWAVGSRWVLPVDQPPIADGRVVIDRRTQRIVAVGRGEAFSAGRFKNVQFDDLGDAVLIPGLVNAHTHLEFSDCESPLGRPGMSLTDWIPLVIAHRQSQLQNPGQRTAAIGAGLAESVAAGVWAIGEISTQPVRLDDYRLADADRCSETHHPSIQTCLFLEQLGRNRSLLPERKREAIHFLESLSRDELNHRPSIHLQAAFSPHAPYSTSPELVEQLVSIARDANTNIAMHLAETEAEIELLEHQTGPFKDLLTRLDVWDSASYRPPVAIRDLLEKLAMAPRSLIVHGNYLTEAELDFVALHRDRMSIVFCPRTHVWFGHREYPLREILSRGIHLAIGTDSRASNPDLCLIRELLQIRKSFPNVSGDAILAAATLRGAIALGIESDYGSLTPGKLAAMSVVRSLRSVDDPFEWLNDTNASCNRV